MFSAQLRPSRFLFAWMLVIAALSAAIVWFSAWPWWACVLVDGLIVVWLKMALQKHWWVGERQLVYRDGCWSLSANDNKIDVALMSEFYLSRWLIILLFKTPDGRKLELVITPDTVDQDGFRRLRGLLKHLTANEVLT